MVFSLDCGKNSLLRKDTTARLLHLCITMYWNHDIHALPQQPYMICNLTSVLPEINLTHLFNPVSYIVNTLSVNYAS